MNNCRPSKYETHVEPNIEVIQGLIRSGFTEESIAKRFGVGRTTWKRHKIRHPEFKQAIIEAQKDIAALAVNSLIKRAQGYDYDEVTTEVHDNGQQQTQSGVSTGRRVIKKVTRHVPPDVAAICVVLFNRMAEKWRHKTEIQHSGEIKQTGVLLTQKPLSRAQWDQYVEQLAASGENRPAGQIEPAPGRMNNPQ